MKKRSGRRVVLPCVLSFMALLLLIAIGFLAVKLYKEQKAADIQQEAEEQNTEEKPDQTAETAPIVEEEIQGEIPEAVQEEIQEEIPEKSQEERIEAFLSGMTLEEKVAQMFFITPEALTGVSSVTAAGEATRSAFDQYPVGGIGYFRQNVISEEQFSAMADNSQTYSEERIGLPLFIGVDEEGGTVTRISRRGLPNVPDIPDMLSIGATGDVRNAYNIGSQLGEYLNRFRVNVDFAPVADVYTNPENTVIGTRSFGNDAKLVSSMVEQEVQGLHDQGMASVLKHFPGHGDTSQDSHSGMASSNKTLDELRACEFLPFQAGIQAGVEFVMMGHISYPNILESDIPATLSYTMTTEILRQELGFEGIVITDAMNMGAVANRYSSAEAAVKAVQAGIDMILMPVDFRAAYEGVLNAVREGTLEESRIDDSVRRILAVKLNI